MKRLAALALILTLFVGPLAADCRQRVVVHRQAVVHAAAVAVVAPVYVAQFVPVQVPTYSVGYAPQQVQQSQDADALARAVEKLTAAVEKLSGGAQPQADNLQSRALGILNARCASCHSDATAKAGGDFVLLKGGQLNPTLDVLDITHAANRAYNGSMPPKGKAPPLSDDEARVLRDWSEQVTQATRAARKAQTK